MDRVLDLLIKVKAEQDGSLSFRRSCAHGICGSDAMLINNRNRLACRIRIDQLGKKISVAPLPGLPVVKDLIVDMSGFFGKYRSVKPYLINDQPEPERERRQSQVERAKFDDTTKCILCAACTSSCPSFWARPEYVGPAAIVQAHRFIFDSRDEGAAGAAGDTGRRGRRVALPDDLQLRRCLPAWHQHHEGDPRGLLGDRGATRLSPKDSGWDSLWESLGAPGPEGPEPPSPDGGPAQAGARSGAVGPAHPDRQNRRRGPGQPRSGVVRRRADRGRWPRIAPAGRAADRVHLRVPGRSDEQRGRVHGRAPGSGPGRGTWGQAVELLLDSKLIVEQLHGRWRVKDAKLIPLHADAKARLSRFARWSATHVPRAQNKQADAMCNAAIDRALAGGPGWWLSGPSVARTRSRL